MKKNLAYQRLTKIYCFNNYLSMQCKGSGIFFYFKTLTQSLVVKNDGVTICFLYKLNFCSYSLLKNPLLVRKTRTEHEPRSLPNYQEKGPLEIKPALQWHCCHRLTCFGQGRLATVLCSGARGLPTKRETQRLQIAKVTLNGIWKCTWEFVLNKIS